MGGPKRVTVTAGGGVFNPLTSTWNGGLWCGGCAVDLDERLRLLDRYLCGGAGDDGLWLRSLRLYLCGGLGGRGGTRKIAVDGAVDDGVVSLDNASVACDRKLSSRPRMSSSSDIGPSRLGLGWMRLWSHRQCNIIEQM